MYYVKHLNVEKGERNAVIRVDTERTAQGLVDTGNFVVSSEEEYLKFREGIKTRV